MWIATIIDKGDFGREIERFLCADQGRANALAGEAIDKLADENGPWYDYSVVWADVKS